GAGNACIKCVYAVAKRDHNDVRQPKRLLYAKLLLFAKLRNLTRKLPKEIRPCLRFTKWINIHASKREVGITSKASRTPRAHFRQPLFQRSDGCQCLFSIATKRGQRPSVVVHVLGWRLEFCGLIIEVVHSLSSVDGCRCRTAKCTNQRRAGKPDGRAHPAKATFNAFGTLV